MRVCEMNRPGFDGGSDDTEGSLSWDSRKYPDELRERATRMTLDALKVIHSICRRCCDLRRCQCRLVL